VLNLTFSAIATNTATSDYSTARGGAICIQNYCTVSLLACTLHDCRTTSNFLDAAGGAIVALDRSRVTATYCTFNLTFALSRGDAARGGAIFITEHSEATLVGCQLQAGFASSLTHADAHGGAVCAVDSSVLNLTDCVFVDFRALSATARFEVRSLRQCSYAPPAL
jgi:hypothetical protein